LGTWVTSAVSIDGSFLGSNRLGGARVIVLDHYGQLSFHRANYSVPIRNAFEVELFAAKEGMELTKYFKRTVRSCLKMSTNIIEDREVRCYLSFEA
jgi:hypothetical protein